MWRILPFVILPPCSRLPPMRGAGAESPAVARCRAERSCARNAGRLPGRDRRHAGDARATRAARCSAPAGASSASPSISTMLELDIETEGDRRPAAACARSTGQPPIVAPEVLIDGRFPPRLLPAPGHPRSMSSSIASRCFARRSLTRRRCSMPRSATRCRSRFRQRPGGGPRRLMPIWSALRSGL